METTAKKFNRDAAIKSMRKVLSLPSGSPERWKAAYRHFLKQKPEAKVEAAQCTQWCAMKRKSVNKFASGNGMRQLMATPSFLLPLLAQLDPDYFNNIKVDELSSAVHAAKMKKAFRQFFIPEVI